MFTTVAIMTLVGSLLAFKARTFFGGKLYTLQNETCVLSDHIGYEVIDFNNPNATVSIDVATPSTCTYPIDFAVEQ